MSILTPQSAVSMAMQSYEVQNALGIKALLARPEFSAKTSIPGSHRILSAEVGTRLINTQDLFGVCARGGGQYANDLFLIFRGTTKSNYGADIFTDLRSGLNMSSTGSMVHAGFNHVFTSMQQQIQSFINQQQNIANIHCIGHSLGGAVANLAADWINQRYQATVKLYTFGAPRVGLGASGFAHKLTYGLKPENIYRAYHRTDPVPMVPVFPFAHAPTIGWSYYLPYRGVLISPSAHSIKNYKITLGKQNWKALLRPEPSFVADIKSWLSSDDKNESVSNASFWEKLNNAAAYVVQTICATVTVPLLPAMTVADHLAMILKKGITLAEDISKWVFFLIRKMMRALGLKVIESAQALTEALIKMVLNRIVNKIYEEVKRALGHL